MNTYENSYKRIVSSTSVLLIAFWLPLSAFALSITKASEGYQSTEMRARISAERNCEYLRLHRSHSPGSDYSATEEQIGFAETDPANGSSNGVDIVRKATENSFSNVIVGFAEADLTNNGFQSAESENDDILINCHSGGNSSVAHSVPGLFSLIEKASE